MTRSERQELCVDNWIRAGGRAAIVGSTGFGLEIHPVYTKIVLLKSKSRSDKEIFGIIIG